MAVAHYKARPVAVNQTFVITGQNIGAFLCKTAGTITVENAKGTKLIDAFPVAAGTLYDFSYFIGSGGGKFTAAGGASGTIGV